MDKILDGLYISNYIAARDEDQLTANKITHILKLMFFARPLTTQHNYLCIKINDTHDENIMQFFPICNNFIHEARTAKSKDNNVLLHCFMGVSRSVTIAIAYIMTITDLGFDEAWRVLRSKRNGARPNLSFQKQLKEFEIKSLFLERYRLRKRFPKSNLYVGDRLKCRLILKDRKSLILERLRFFIANRGTNTRKTDPNEEDDNDENDQAAELTDAQRQHLHNIAQTVRDRRKLIPTNIALNMNLLERTVLMPRAVLYEALAYKRKK